MSGSVARLSAGSARVSSLTALDDGALIERARRGEDRAFQALVERYEGRVAATVIGMLGPGPEAEDIGQETFIRFYRSMERYRGDAALGTYLTRIAINLSLTALKRHKFKRRLFVASENTEHLQAVSSGSDVHETLESRLQIDRVRRAIDALEPRQRAVVVVRMIDGYSTREAAEILGVPNGTVMSRLSRAMTRLEGLLENDDE